MTIESDGISLNLRISVSEYSLLKSPRGSILLLPADPGILEEWLTTGKLGNGNRIMLPNKVMKKYHVKELHKKVPAGIFEVNGGKFLLIKLEEHKPGVPTFKGEQDE